MTATKFKQDATTKALEFRMKAVQAGGPEGELLHLIADIHSYYAQQFEILRTAAGENK